MGNERIDEILKDPTQHPMKVIEGLLPEITRLLSLVQAQKELIEWMGIKLPSLSHENKCKMADFLNQIKKLEA